MTPALLVAAAVLLGADPEFPAWASTGGVGAAAIGAIVWLLGRHDNEATKRDAAVKELTDRFNSILEKKDALLAERDARYERIAGEIREAVDGVSSAIDEFRRDAAARDARSVELATKMVAAVEHVTGKLTAVEIGMGRVETAVSQIGTEVKVLTTRVDRLEPPKSG